ncbi:hypothetical protein FOZ62_032349, partial [Perkinsus olseni]
VRSASVCCGSVLKRCRRREVQKRVHWQLTIMNAPWTPGLSASTLTVGWLMQCALERPRSWRIREVV